MSKRRRLTLLVLLLGFASACCSPGSERLEDVIASTSVRESTSNPWRRETVTYPDDEHLFAAAEGQRVRDPRPAVSNAPNVIRFGGSDGVDANVGPDFPRERFDALNVSLRLDRVISGEPSRAP